MNLNTYAFDNTSILHTFQIVIPLSHRIIFQKETLEHKNYLKLNILIKKLANNSIKKYRFVPSNLEENIVKVANDLILSTGIQISLLPKTLKAELIDQLNEFTETISTNYEVIEKGEDIEPIREIFVKNQKPLKKGKNIPENEDLQIICGYQNFSSNGLKYLISEDEHFCGYSDIIQNNFNIYVIEEWNCHKLI